MPFVVLGAARRETNSICGCASANCPFMTPQSTCVGDWDMTFRILLVSESISSALQKPNREEEPVSTLMVLSLSYLNSLGRLLHGSDDLVVARAAAEVAGQLEADV